MKIPALETVRHSRNREFLRISMSWGIEFGPIIVFFLTSETLGFMKATTLFVGLTALALIIAGIKDRRMAVFPLVAGLSVIVSGALTLIYNEPFYLIIKDTVYNAGFALAIYISQKYCGKALLKSLFSSLFHMTDRGWRILSTRWMVAFIILTIGNEVARRVFDADGWVVYKMLSTLGTIIFGLYQLTLSKKERLPDSNKWGMNVK